MVGDRQNKDLAPRPATELLLQLDPLLFRQIDDVTFEKNTKRPFLVLGFAKNRNVDGVDAGASQE